MLVSNFFFKFVAFSVKFLLVYVMRNATSPLCQLNHLIKKLSNFEKLIFLLVSKVDFNFKVF